MSSVKKTPREIQLESKLIEIGKADVNKRLESLRDSGRCTPAEFRQKLSAIGVQKMSLVGDKVQTGDLGVWLESREALPGGACWSKEEKLKKMSAAEASPQRSSWDTKQPEDVEAQKKAKKAMLQR